MTFSVGALTINVVSARHIKSINWDVVTVVVWGSEGAIDRFDIFCDNSVWRAWTCDTLSEARISRRHAIAAEYSRLRNLGAA